MNNLSQIGYKNLILTKSIYFTLISQIAQISDN